MVTTYVLLEDFTPQQVARVVKYVEEIDRKNEQKEETK